MNWNIPIRTEVVTGWQAGNIIRSPLLLWFPFVAVAFLSLPNVTVVSSNLFLAV